MASRRCFLYSFLELITRLSIPISRISSATYLGVVLTPRFDKTAAILLAPLSAGFPQTQSECVHASPRSVYHRPSLLFCGRYDCRKYPVKHRVHHIKCARCISHITWKALEACLAAMMKIQCSPLSEVPQYFVPVFQAVVSFL